MARLPQPGGDDGTWGDVLNDYLSQTHKPDGALKDNSVTANTLAPNSVTNSAIASDAVNAASIADGSITETLLDGSVQTKLNATGDWNTLSNKPTVIAAGADQAAARTAIGAGTSNLAIGTSGTTAKAGDYTPTKSDVGLGNVDNTSDTNKPVSTATQTALDAKARAALLYDPATKSDGQLASTLSADTGQTMTAFVHTIRPAPLTISSGVLTHTPAAGGNSAGYLQADLGGRVRRIGAMVSWPLNALGIVALVIPSAAWAPNTLPNAGFHLGVNGNGIWTLTRYTTGGSTTIASYLTHGRFDTTTWGTGLKPLEVWLDPDNQRAVITWPDGTTSTITSAYFASETSNYAVWELFENNGSTDVTASFGKLWADTAPTTPDITGLTTYRSPGRNAPAPYSASGALSLNLAQASVHIITLTGNATSFAFTSPQYSGQEIEVQFIQDATGSRTLAGVSSTIKWAAAAAPTLTTTANRRDIFRFRFYNTQYFEVSRSMNVG